jgi:hypothetical protein
MVIAGREDFMREDDVQIGKPKWHGILLCKSVAVPCGAYMQNLASF